MKTNWSKKIKKFLIKQEGDKTRFEATPYKDWRLVVFVFVVGLVGSLVFSVYLFLGVSNDSFFTQPTTKIQGVTLDVEKLSAVLEVLNKKENLFSSLNIATSTLVDPSL